MTSYIDEQRYLNVIDADDKSAEYIGAGWETKAKGAKNVFIHDLFGAHIYRLVLGHRGCVCLTTTIL